MPRCTTRRRIGVPHAFRRLPMNAKDPRGTTAEAHADRVRPSPEWTAHAIERRFGAAVRAPSLGIHRPTRPAHGRPRGDGPAGTAQPSRWARLAPDAR